MTIDKLKSLQIKKELFIYSQTNNSKNIEILFDNKENRLLKLIK